jgi:hypothetical protein
MSVARSLALAPPEPRPLTRLCRTPTRAPRSAQFHPNLHTPLARFCARTVHLHPRSARSPCSAYAHRGRDLPGNCAPLGTVHPAPRSPYVLERARHRCSPAQRHTNRSICTPYSRLALCMLTRRPFSTHLYRTAHFPADLATEFAARKLAGDRGELAGDRGQLCCGWMGMIEVSSYLDTDVVRT